MTPLLTLTQAKSSACAVALAKACQAAAAAYTVVNVIKQMSLMIPMPKS